MEQAETTAKLVALHRAVGRILEDPRGRYFDPAVVSEFFERWAPIRDALRLGFQSVLGDLPVRALPVSSGTTDHEGRGYIIRQAIDQLYGDMQYALDALATNATRAQLAKLYGEEAVQLAHFPRVAGGLSQASARDELARRIAHVQCLVEDLDRLPDSTGAPLRGRRIFIGHGHSPLWRELKDFIAERLHLPWDEFNREPVAGLTTTERLQTMVAQAAFAFLVLTADEEHADAQLHPRSNVVHEVGLFQGRLSFNRAIVLLEKGCAEFSNIAGLSQIRFPRGDIAARFEEVRRVLERERLV